MNKGFNEENIISHNNEECIVHYSNKTKIDKVEKEVINRFFYQGKILDLGCGCGRTTTYLFNEGYKDIIGVDINEEMIKIAKKKYPKINFQVGDACNLKFKDNSFDIVFFSAQGIDCIYPEEKIVLALKEIERVLKPSFGRFVFSSHNNSFLHLIKRPKFLFRNLTNIHSKYKLENEKVAIFHYYYSSPNNWKRLIKESTSFKFLSKLNGNPHPHYVFEKGIDKNG